MTELTVKAVVDNIPRVTAFVDELLEKLGCPMKVKTQIEMALDELFCNIARYAYGPESGDATIRFEYQEASRTISITFMDHGIPFNPLEKEDPDVSLPAEKREIGGLGIYLVKKTMDRVEYRYENGMNILSIMKQI